MAEMTKEYQVLFDIVKYCEKLAYNMAQSQILWDSSFLT